MVIDNDLQVTEFDERNYHEMLVHVPLNYLPNAKNVLIIGGGDGGTLREVCRHPNVEKIKMIEIDEEVINLSKKYLPNIANSYDDERLELFIEDGAKWVKRELQTSERYDVILLDTTDFSMAESLFTKEFNKDIKNLLKRNGILCLNFDSLGWDKSDNIWQLEEMMKPLFKYVYLYQIFQPTYGSGHYSHCFCSNTINPKENIVDWRKFNKKNIECRYYNKNIHESSFHLPEFVFESKKKEIIGYNINVIAKGIGIKNLENKKLIKSMMEKIIELFDLKVVNFVEKKFKPIGYTCIYLLEESHLSIHTWREKSIFCIYLFTCGKFHNFQKAKLLIKNILNPKEIKIKYIPREI